MRIDLSTLISLASAAITLISVGIGIGTFKQKIAELTHAVEKHNKVMERTFAIEANIGDYDIGAIVAKQDSMQETINEIKTDIKHYHQA